MTWRGCIPGFPQGHNPIDRQCKLSNHVQEQTLPTIQMKQDLWFRPFHVLFFVLQAFCLWHGELPLRIWLSRWIMPIQSIQGNWCWEFHPLINNWCKALFYRNEHSHIPPLPLACLPNHYLPSYQWMSLLLRALLTQSVADSSFKQACKRSITRIEGRCFSPHR